MERLYTPNPQPIDPKSNTSLEIMILLFDSKFILSCMLFSCTVHRVLNCFCCFNTDAVHTPRLLTVEVTVLHTSVDVKYW